ncbi:MAG: PorT family protein [Prevotella sp.]|jgi:hypothetical protein|nr:PorT family protein [Prevotella sp.]
MKQIIKITLATLLFVASLAANAQERKFIFGAKAGFVFSGLDGYFYETEIKSAFTGGFTFDYFLNSGLHLSSAIEFVNKGAKFDFKVPKDQWVERTYEKSTVSAMYIQLPVHIGYRFNVSRRARLYIDAGPYIACGIGGQTELGDNVRLKLPEGDETKSLDEWMKQTNGWRRSGNTFGNKPKSNYKEYHWMLLGKGFKEFDWGLGAGLAIEYDHINIGLKYDFGLYNLSQEDNNVKNRSAYATLGYKF